LLCAAKGTLLIGVALLILSLRRFSAAQRHAILLASLVGGLLLPIGGWLLPSLSPRSIPQISGETPAGRWSDDALALLMVRSEAGRGVPVRESWRAVVENGNIAILVLWSTGATLLLLRVVMNLAAAHRVRSRAVLSAHAASRVLLLESADIGAPVTTGLFRPAIMFPKRSVLTPAVLEHELAHVKRRDCFTLFATQIVCSFYWFNPLVWFAARRIALEQERAADDCVLASGEDPVAYSDLLLRTARGQTGALRLSAAPSIALPSHLERRIKSILDTGTERGMLSRWSVAAIAMATLCVTLPMAAFAVHDGPPPAGDAFGDPQSERVPGVRLYREVRVLDSGPDGALIAMLASAAAREAEGPYDLVPDRARWALSRVQNGQLIASLIASLNDRDWRVRGYAAWALGLCGDSHAVQPLIPLLEDPVWRLRAIAAAALRDLGYPQARNAMATALHDPAWQVRVEAVAYFRALEDPSAREQLESLRNDPHIAVRLAADEAISNLR
jgi:hypothetical protein